MKQAGFNLSKAKQHNGVLVKLALYKSKNLSRLDLSHILKLTPATITAFVNRLIDQKQIREISSLVEKTGAGRRPICLELVNDSSYYIGMEIGAYGIYYVLIDLLGNTICSRIDEKASSSYETLLSEIKRNVDLLIADSNIEFDKIKGFGLGTPGVVDKESGIVHFSHSTYLFNGKDICKDIQDMLKIKTYILNNVRARALSAELNKNDFEDHSFLYFFVSVGIVCPYVHSSFQTNSTLITDGEVGKMMIHYDLTDKYNEKNDISHIANETAIVEKCIDLLTQNKAPILGKIISNKKDKIISKEDVLLAMEHGDEDVALVIDEAIHYLGISLCNLINMLNPNEIFIEGFIFNNDANKQRIVKVINDMIYSKNYYKCKINFIDYDIFKGAHSAAMCAIYKFFITEE
jgi:predicted NBD/HSP70 family sugar kinase